MSLRRTLLGLALVLFGGAIGACAAVGAAGTVAGTAVGVAGTAAGAAVKVAGTAAGLGMDAAGAAGKAVTGGSKP